MNPEPTDPPKRRSTRLAGFDYTSPNAYFITICTDGQQNLFGRVRDDSVELNGLGRVALAEWEGTARLRPSVHLDAFVVMPNHVHGVLFLVNERLGAGTARRAPTGGWTGGQKGAERAGGAPAVERFGKPVPGSLPSIVRAYKSAVSRSVNRLRGTPGAPVWQKNYWEHVIRSERALRTVRTYIEENPLRWALDRYNPEAVGSDPKSRTLWQLLQNDAEEQHP